jgi:hypothetical protein
MRKMIPLFKENKMKMINFFICICIFNQIAYPMRQASRATVSKAVQAAEKRNILMQKLQDLFTQYQEENPTITQEQKALYHFQNTKAPSGSYVPIIPVEERNRFIGAYNSLSCSIKLNNRWYKAAPSVQYATLLHEYRHRLQHIAGIFDEELQNENANRSFYPAIVTKKARLKKVSLNFNTYTEQSWKPFEYDADLFATTHITCPTCLKICQCSKHTDASHLGYFNKDDIQPFIDAAEFNPTCPAHSLISGDFEHNKIVKTLDKKLNLYKIFPGEILFDEIMILDKRSGTLLDHIPTYAIDLISSLKEYDDFAQLLINKTIKEIDVAQQIKQTERDIAQGKFKMIAAGNEPIISEVVYPEIV